ncbi:MAG: hypothetical protein AAF753_11845 [Pseudomonadota bacterium]
MTAYEFWMPLVLLLVAGGGGVLFANWSRRRLHKKDGTHPAE